MSRPPKFSPKGRPRKPKITAGMVLEALYRIETAGTRPYPATIAEVAAEVPCCRNSAMDLLAVLQGGPLVELQPVRVTGKRVARAYALSFAGRLRVERLRREEGAMTAMSQEDADPDFEALGLRAPADKIGPEDLLVWELVDAVSGKAPRSDEWRKDHGGAAYLSGAGSANWKPVDAAVKYARDPESIREWLLEAFFPLQRRRYMVSEVMSLIYGSMHLGAFVSIAQTAERLGDPWILREARACIRLYLWILLMRQCPDGRVLVAGCRSAGHAAWEHGDPWARWCLALATGSGEREAWAGLKVAGEGPGNAWQSEVFIRCAEQLRAAAEPFAKVLPEGFESVGFSAMTGLHVVRCEGGVATWIDRNVNANTKPEMLSVWRDGKIFTVPGPTLAAQGGQRVNRGWVEATSMLDGDTFRGSVGGVGFVHPLPGRIVSRFDLAAESDAPTEEPKPRPQNPPPEIGVEELAAAVVALGAQEAETAAAVALVRAAQWTAASLAVFRLAVPRKNQGARVDLSDRLGRMA